MADDAMPVLPDFGMHLPATRERYSKLTRGRQVARMIAMLRERGEYDPARHQTDKECPPLTVREHLEVLFPDSAAGEFGRLPADVRDAVAAGATWRQTEAVPGGTEADVRGICRKQAGKEHPRSGERAGIPPSRVITLDLPGDDDYFVLTGTIGEWAARQRHRIDNGGDDAGMRRRRADAAAALLDRIKPALDGQP
jgi:hypothetical protein